MIVGTSQSVRLGGAEGDPARWRITRHARRYSNGWYSWYLELGGVVNKTWWSHSGWRIIIQMPLNPNNPNAVRAFSPLFNELAKILSTTWPTWRVDRREPPWPLDKDKQDHEAPLAVPTIRINTGKRVYEIYLDPYCKIIISSEAGRHAKTIDIEYSAGATTLDPQKVDPQKHAADIAGFVERDNLPA